MEGRRRFWSQAEHMVVWKVLEGLKQVKFSALNLERPEPAENLKFATA